MIIGLLLKVFFAERMNNPINPLWVVLTASAAHPYFKGTPTTDQLTKYLGQLFLETGVPNFLHTDDGGSMRGHFKMWCNDLGVVVEKSSAFNPISNGTAERHVQVAKRMLDIAKEEKIPVEEAMARLRASQSSIDGFSPSRLFFGRELRNPLLPAISDGQEEQLLGKQRQITKDEERIKRNSKVGKSLPRYVPKVGDLVLLQNQRTKRWDCPATVHLVCPGNRSAYVVAEDDGQMYLRSHTFLRLRQPEDSAVDTVPDPDSDTVSPTSDDPAPGSQASITRTQAVVNNSIVQPSQGKLPPRNLMAQLALSCTEELGQSSSEEAPRKKVRFFLPCEHGDSTSDKRDVTCEGYPTEAGLKFDCCCRKTTSAHAFCLPTNRDDDDVKNKGDPDQPGHVGGFGFGDGSRHQAPLSTSSEEIEVVEPYGELHQGPKLFDFSNMKVAGSSTLIILGTLAAVSYFCRRRIISKLSRNQAPFVPSHPAAAAPAPAVTYNQATGLALLPDINYQTLPQPFRGQVQDFCSIPQPQHASRLTPSFVPPSSKIPSSGDLDRLKLGPLPPSYREATDMEDAMHSLDQNAARVALSQATKTVGQ